MERSANLLQSLRSGAGSAEQLEYQNRAGPKAFLHPDRSKRLGNLIGGAQDVLEHPWFRGVDWEALERREIRVRTLTWFTHDGISPLV